MQQIEPENPEKIELEHRDKPKFIETFGNFGPSDFCCKEENRHTFNLNVCSKYLFPIETAMEEITALLTEKHDSENRDDSKLKTFSVFLDINILIQESNQKLLNRFSLYNYRAFDWHVDARNQTGWFDLIDWFVTTPKKSIEVLTLQFEH